MRQGDPKRPAKGLNERHTKEPPLESMQDVCLPLPLVGARLKESGVHRPPLVPAGSFRAEAPRWQP